MSNLPTFESWAINMQLVAHSRPNPDKYIRTVLDLCQATGFANAKTFSAHTGIKIETARDRLIGTVYGGFLTVYHIDFRACYAVTDKGINYLKHSDLIGDYEVDRAYNSIVQNRVSSATRQFFSLKTPQQLAMGA